MKMSFFALSFLSLLTLCLPTPSNAMHEENNPIPTDLGGNCSIPAPIDFHIESMSQGSVIFGWTPFTAQAQHRIRVYRSSDNALIRTQIAPSGSTSLLVDSLPTAFVGYAKINAICNDGSHSINESSVPDFGVPILDLVVKHASSFTESYCTIDVVNGACIFPNNFDEIYEFRVTKGSQVCNFDIKKVIESSLTRYKCVATFQENFNFYCNGFQQLSNPPCYSAREIVIKFKEGSTYVDAVKFNIDINAFTTNAIRCNFLLPGYKVERLFSINEYWESPGGDSGTESHSPFPNPFDKELTLPNSMEFTNMASINLQNINGQVVLQETIPANQSSHTLSTAHLAPGFYFLRVEPDGEVQTFKVIKSAQ